MSSTNKFLDKIPAGERERVKTAALNRIWAHASLSPNLGITATDKEINAALWGYAHCLDEHPVWNERMLLPQWTNTETATPDFNVAVLVFIPEEDNHITAGMLDIDGAWTLLDEYRKPECQITHWMPMPSDPIN